MFNRSFAFFALIALFTCVACSSRDATKNTATTNTPAANTAEAKPVATPRTDFTAADIAKLKWIVGTWRGMDGKSPFFERYKLEGTRLVVETLKEDGSLDGPPGAFELKDGAFGRTEGSNRSAASEITDKYVQFVPAGGSTKNSFRFEDDGDGTWTATLEWSDANGTPQKKTYNMEPWKPEK